MANLIIVCGPQAVGKMTVAESLRDKLKYNMMMNHDSIEISDRIVGFATPARRVVSAAVRDEGALRMRHTPCGCAPYGEGAFHIRRARPLGVPSA